MFGNENDRPYVLKAPPEGVAGMTAVVQAVKPHLKVPFGVNYLWDPLASVAIAAATGASFVREIFTGLFASDMGLWQADCAGAVRLRHNLGRDDMKLLFNINAEFAHSLDERPIALRAKSAVFSSLADAILVSGPLTGDPVDRSNLKTVREAVPDVPVLANTGVTIDNVRDILAISDGVVIGTHFKVDGNTWNPVDGCAGQALHGRRGEAEVTAAHDVSFPRTREVARLARTRDWIPALRGYDKASEPRLHALRTRPRHRHDLDHRRAHPTAG